MRTLLTAILFLFAAAALMAQAPPAQTKPTAPAPAPAPAPAAEPQTGTEPQTAAEDNLEEMVKDELQSSDTTYRYDPRGRRDPFRSLLKYQTTVEKNCQQGTVGCLMWDEITLQGIWKVRGAFISQILAKNGDVYWVKEGDALFDGQVTRIGIDCIYFKQKVNDPTKINPFRDVEKCLAP